MSLRSKYHPIVPLTVYRSKDNGKHWNPEKITIHPDENGNTLSMHMNEHGITLKHGKYAGRLIRPTRNYDGGNVAKCKIKPPVNQCFMQIPQFSLS